MAVPEGYRQNRETVYRADDTSPIPAGGFPGFQQINTRAVKRWIRQGPYVWPGGYPLYAITSDGAALCFGCLKSEWPSICRSIRDYPDDCGSADGWRVVGVDINYEDGDLYCDHCSNRIESAYAEPDDPAD